MKSMLKIEQISICFVAANFIELLPKLGHFHDFFEKNSFILILTCPKYI